MSSLETALYLLRESLDLRPADHALHSNSLDNLALALLVKFHWTEDVSALDEAILLMGRKLMGSTLPLQSVRASPEIEVAEERVLRVCEYMISISTI